MTSPEDSRGTSVFAGSEHALAIHTEELSKVYPGADFAAVDRLNLDVRAGEIFGLLGPNGAGKTTTAGMLTTRVVPTSGRGFVGGVNVATHPALVKQLSGIVSQQNTLAGATAYAHTVDEQIPVANLEQCYETLRSFLDSV